MSLSTHILDTGLGQPAAGVHILLSQQLGDTFHPLAEGHTDADGRCRNLLEGRHLEAATYCLRFDTGPHFAGQNLRSLYPYVDITFTIHNPAEHHHIPLLIAANGYTTYRGS